MTFADLLVLASEEGEHNVMLETFPFGVIALAVFGLLALVTFSYKNVANRHSPKAEAFAAANSHDAHGAGH